jgi:hypothetical protein
MNMEVTYVTALFNLRKREGFDNVDSDHFSSMRVYLEHARKLLDTSFPFVIFCEPDLEASLREIRGDRPTKFIVLEFEQLPFWHLFPKIIENNECNPVVWVSPEKFTNHYYLIINHKAEFMRSTAEANPFNTEWFAWVDVRIVLPETHLNGLTQWWDPDRVNLTMMSLIDRNRVKDRYSFFRNNHGWTAGGFFAGKRTPMLDFTKTMIHEWKRALEERYCPSDETMLTYMCCIYPNTVTPCSFGEYGDLLCNQAAVCRRQDRIYSIQEFALVQGDIRISIQAGEGLRRAYLKNVLPPMADHEVFHIFYRLLLAYERADKFQLAEERKKEIQSLPELRPMVERFAPHLLTYGASV